MSKTFIAITGKVVALGKISVHEQNVSPDLILKQQRMGPLIGRLPNFL